ncbi:MAG: hypothetical protein ABI533_10655 [Betaproteobacteria bacterium]
MAWLLIESLFALVVLVAIVAWTMAPQRKRRPPHDDRSDGDPPPSS